MFVVSLISVTIVIWGKLFLTVLTRHLCLLFSFSTDSHYNFICQWEHAFSEGIASASEQEFVIKKEKGSKRKNEKYSEVNKGTARGNSIFIKFKFSVSWPLGTASPVWLLLLLLLLDV